MWLADAFVRVLVYRERRWLLVSPAIALVLALGYGTVKIRELRTPRGALQEILIVQGAAKLLERHDQQSAYQYTAQLYDLTQPLSHAGALIVWPEGAIPAFLPAALGSVRERPLLPWFGGGEAWLLGAYAVDEREARYNAAFAVHPDGTVPRPYFKRVLIPFGESVPFGSVFPWLTRLMPKAGLFTPGTSARVFDYPMSRSDGTSFTLRVSPLVCYEDTIPSLACESTAAGAELLVNLTSDFWFGRSAALRQHHLIASFRAIENRRYLVRATTTGVSAVVDPLGRTVAEIPAAASGTITARIVPLRQRSTYTHTLRDRPWWGLLAVGVGVIAVQRGRGWWQGRSASASEQSDRRGCI
jgi:apolipoprotein N-acyltransferase